MRVKRATRVNYAKQFASFQKFGYSERCLLVHDVNAIYMFPFESEPRIS